MSAEIAGGRRSPEENAAIAAEIVALRQQKAEADAKVRRQSEGLLDVSLDDDHAAQAPAPAPAPAPAAAPAAAAAPVGATDYSQYYSSSSADMVQAAATAAPAAAPAAPPPAAAAEQSPVRSPGPRVSELEITASFVSEGRLGLHFREDSDPPFIVLAVRDGGLASKQPQIRPGIVLKSVNGKPVEGQSYDKIVHALTKSPRPLELGFWRSAPPAARVVSAAVVGTRLVKNPGWLSGSSTEYVIDATTVDGRRRTVHRTYAELKILHLAWVEPLSAVGVSPTFPVDVLFGANDETVVKERAKQLHGWLGAAFAMSQTLRCPLLEDALQRALTANPAGRQVGVGTDNVRSHLRTVIEGALPPGPRAGIANVWDCAGFWSWGSAADFIASAKATHGRADDALAVTVPHMLEIGELEGNWKKAFESIVSEREEGDGAEGEAKPGCWAYADEVGGAARFLAKDGAGGGEARFSGLWRSIDSGAKLEMCVGTLEMTDCWGHTWTRRGTSDSGASTGSQWVDIRVASLPQIRDLRLEVENTGTILKFGMETTGIWTGAKIVAINHEGVKDNVAIWEQLNKVEEAGVYGADLVLTVEVPSKVSMRVLWRKECRGLTDLGWTRHLAREECVVDGTEYSEGGLVAFGPRDCYQLPAAMRAEPFSGQTVMGSPTR